MSKSTHLALFCAIFSCCCFSTYSSGQTLTGSSLNVSGTATIGTIHSDSVSASLLSSGTAWMNALSVSGTVDISGNSLFLGTVYEPETLWLNGKPGIQAYYQDTGGSSCFKFISTRAPHDWLWAYTTPWLGDGEISPVMNLSNGRVLTIYDENGNPGIVLDPANQSGSNSVLTVQAADERYDNRYDNRYLSRTAMTVGTAPSIAFTGGNATGGCSFAGMYATASGANSVALGLWSNASGANSVALGNWSTASGWNSTTLGYESTASGVNSITLGNASAASGWSSITLGSQSKATGGYALAAGYGSTAGGGFSMAFGQYSCAGGENSMTLGVSSIASGYYSIAMGTSSTASGVSSIAAGPSTVSSGFAQFVIGQSNVPQGNPSYWDPSDNLFIIGNGAPYYRTVWVDGYSYDVYNDHYDDQGNYIGTDVVTYWVDGYYQEQAATGTSNAFVVKKSGDTTVYGSLTVSAPDGSTAATPAGFSTAYADGSNGVGASITQSATRPTAVWNWQRLAASGSAVPVMQIDVSNRLVLTGTDAVNPPQLVLDPNGQAGSSGVLTQASADSRYVVNGGSAGTVLANTAITGTAAVTGGLAVTGTATLNGDPLLTQTAANTQYVLASSGTASNLALSGSTSVSGAVNVTGTTKVTGRLVITGTLDASTNTVVATDSSRLMLIPQQGDLSMGNFTVGEKPQ